MATRLWRLERFCALGAWTNGRVGRSTQALCGVMIDRTARNTIAEATRHYLAGLSTNFVFDDAMFDLRSDDPAIKAIRDQLWLIYDDLREHTVKEAGRLTTEQRDIVLRIIVFLKNDCEYRWPAVPEWYPAVRPLIALGTLGFGTRALDRKFFFKDPDDIWPFRNREEIREAMSKPKYLASGT